MKVEVQSRKLVKPCTPTPSHLRSYKISIIDELNPSMHVIRILYYPPDAVNGKQIHLEESLAEVLPLFYPLAGRYIKQKHLVDCNDGGAEYSEAQVDCELLEIIGPGVGSEQLNHLLPLDIGAADEPTDPMLAVQINRFQCGGLAIGVCASHRIFDSCSLGIFLTAWANAVADGELVITPDFDSPSFFPSENVAPLDFGVSRSRDSSIVGKRFGFDKNAISKLRDSASPEWRSTTSERPPSRVVVVSAVLTQALLRADRSKHGESRASLIAQAINVRERTVPPVPKYACGTWVSISYLEYTANESHSLEYDYPGLVLKMREATMQGVKDCARILSEKEFGRWVLVDSYFEAAKKASSPDYKVIWITDWSKFGDYQLDFGFGKPVWVSLADVPLQDLFILMNTKENDGIEAWVYLHESDMPFFEQDEDIRMLTLQ
ncbi:hypothetical protein Pfo_016534 [Paulownia fortunei]|nr:hypothetical protein Pfo_016534 [Paulownia fortunei]